MLDCDDDDAYEDGDIHIKPAFDPPKFTMKYTLSFYQARTSGKSIYYLKTIVANELACNSISNYQYNELNNTS